MVLKNLTKNKIISDNISIAKNLFQKTIGLINASRSKALYFETRWGIHTFGVNFPIDCIVCDNKLRIISIKKNIAKNKFFVWNPKYFRIIELPSGSIDISQTEIDDILSIN